MTNKKLPVSLEKKIYSPIVRVPKILITNSTRKRESEREMGGGLWGRGGGRWGGSGGAFVFVHQVMGSTP